jgi:hypothetical protein
MITSFQCANCNRITEVKGPGRFTIQCQSCGCWDVSFTESVLVGPSGYGEEGELSEVIKDTPFYGNNLQGGIWNIQPLPKVEKEEKPKILKTRGTQGKK